MLLTIIICVAMAVYLITYVLDRIMQYKQTCQKLESERLRDENTNIKQLVVLVKEFYIEGFVEAGGDSAAAAASFDQEFHGPEDLRARIRRLDAEAELAGICDDEPGPSTWHDAASTAQAAVNDLLDQTNR